RAGRRRDVLLEGAVDLALLRRALQPDARVGAALYQHGMVVARHGADVARQDRERGVPGCGPGGVGGGEVRPGCACRGRRWVLLRVGNQPYSSKRQSGSARGKRGLLQEIPAEHAFLHAHQCKASWIDKGCGAPKGRGTPIAGGHGINWQDEACKPRWRFGGNGGGGPTSTGGAA